MSSSKLSMPRLGRRVVVIAGVVMLVFLAVGAYRYLTTGGPIPVTLTGVVTTDDVRVGSMLQGRIEELAVQPGDIVDKGQILARIEPLEPRADVAFYSNSEQASASAVDEALAELKLLEQQTKQEIRQAEATLEMNRALVAQAQATLENAQLTYARQTKLRADQLNAVQDVDQARVAHDTAAAALESAQKQAAAAEASLALVKTNAEEVEARRAALERTRQTLAAARAQTDKAKVRLGYTEIRAPIDGVVDVRVALEGEVVSPGDPIVTLIDPDDLWIRADLEESYIERIRLGDVLEVRLPSGQVRMCPVFYRGVDAEYATQRDVSRTKRDIKTFEIRLRCDNGDRSLALGMTAYVTVPLS